MVSVLEQQSGNTTNVTIKHKYFKERTYEEFKREYQRWLQSGEPTEILKIIPITSYYGVRIKVTYKSES